PALGVLSPVVRCHVDATAGKHFVRVVHVAPAIAFHPRHLISITGDTASILSRFALATPSWGTVADVTMFDGVPGTEQPLRIVAHSTMALDGATTAIAMRARTVPARLRRIYDGAVHDRDLPPTEPSWGRESRRAVWVVLEL